MELMDVLRNRRAVRDYSGDRLTRQVIERLIEAAILAPSAMNLQPWAFAALLDPERIHSYGECARKWLVENPAAIGLGDAALEILKRPGYDLFHHAPALVMVMAQSTAAQPMEDCCLAAQNLMLAARDEGIGSCWIGFGRPWLNLPSTKKELALPEGYHVVAPIVLGRPRVWPESHGRKPAEIHWI
ncbi:MAG TPA: nitroreductase family protein [Bryobacteraceae bacterium]|nr:nitroreductase family protein [Bryobacteraceae bacterium]